MAFDVEASPSRAAKVSCALAAEFDPADFSSDSTVELLLLRTPLRSRAMVIASTVGVADELWPTCATASVAMLPELERVVLLVPPLMVDLPCVNAMAEVSSALTTAVELATASEWALPSRAVVATALWLADTLCS